MFVKSGTPKNGRALRSPEDQGCQLLSLFRHDIPEVGLESTVGARLYTIGYEGRSQAAYLRALASRSVTILCDLRRPAVSSNADFSRLALADACAQAGICYAHLWQLGIHSGMSMTRRSTARRTRAYEDFRLRVLPNQQPLLNEIHDWLVNGESIALACVERDPLACHRICITDQLQETFGELCEPIHL